MKIEVLKTLKGGIGELFAKGTVFVSPDIPQTILEEVGANRGTIRVLEGDLVEEKVVPVVTAPPVSHVDAPVLQIPESKSTHSKKHPRMKR